MSIDAAAGLAVRRRGKPPYRYGGHYVLKVSGPKGHSELKGKLNGCEAG